jgi:hypothetical protein
MESTISETSSRPSSATTIENPETLDRSSMSGVASISDQSIPDTGVRNTPVLAARNDPRPLSGANPPAESAKATGKATSSSLSCKCSKSGRNLVVCIDGTANQFGVKVRIFILDSRHLSLSVAECRTPTSLNYTVALKKTRGNLRTTTAGLGLTSRNRLRFATCGR